MNTRFIEMNNSIFSQLILYDLNSVLNGLKRPAACCLSSNSGNLNEQLTLKRLDFY
jgi:hypothetical protein